MDSATSIAGRHVLLVEDIVDTGLTLSYLLGLLETRRPASLATVTLLDKRTRRIVDVPLRYRGFEVGDEFLLGYGLDWEGRYRNLPGPVGRARPGRLPPRPRGGHPGGFRRAR